VKLLILGATGMLGHKLMQSLSKRFEVTGTVRGSVEIYKGHQVLGNMPLIGMVKAEKFERVGEVVAKAQPDAIINCIGIIKQHPAANDSIQSININALFPHRLAKLCQTSGIRLIHLSTDCVFSGRKGNYSEDDVPDPDDLYGRTKLLGEVVYPGCLTIRTSMIGRELRGKAGLVEWFLSQRGKRVNGFSRAIFTGFTTGVLADLIGDLANMSSPLYGLWHVSSDPISKYDLLELINRKFQLDITIDRDEVFHCDRSLNSIRFRKATRFKVPSWEEMIDQMARDPTPYNELV
jgi:dTDP-4-dehydrorhamnose reductase